jgi:predicted small integral membrane protein
MVAKMQDTFSIKKNGWRSINRPFLHYVFFTLIVVWEISIAVFIWIGSFKMLSNLRGSIANFKKAKTFTSIGLSLGVLLWFVVFLTIGGEWFLMWQSKTWNAQPTAFFLTCCFLLFLIHHNQEDE